MTQTAKQMPEGNVIRPYQFQMNPREKVSCPLTTLTRSEIIAVAMKLLDSKKFQRENPEIMAKLDAAIEEDFTIAAQVQS